MVIPPSVRPRRTRNAHRLLLVAALLAIVLCTGGCRVFFCGLQVVEPSYEVTARGASIRWSPGPTSLAQVTVRWSGTDPRCQPGEKTRTIHLPGGRWSRWLYLHRMNVPIGSPDTQHCNWTIQLHPRNRGSEVRLTPAETDIWYDHEAPWYETPSTPVSAAPSPARSKP